MDDIRGLRFESFVRFGGNGCDLEAILRGEGTSNVSAALCFSSSFDSVPDKEYDFMDSVHCNPNGSPSSILGICSMNENVISRCPFLIISIMSFSAVIGLLSFSESTYTV